MRFIQESGPDDIRNDAHQPDTDLEFILIDKAKPGSDIMYQITNLKWHGGVHMYAEVYMWFMETFSPGL